MDGEITYTIDEVNQILSNVGVDVTCERCISIAMTGWAFGELHTCGRENGDVIITSGQEI
jgi:hypothetical protein